MDEDTIHLNMWDWASLDCDGDVGIDGSIDLLPTDLLDELLVTCFGESAVGIPELPSLTEEDLVSLFPSIGTFKSSMTSSEGEISHAVLDFEANISTGQPQLWDDTSESLEWLETEVVNFVLTMEKIAERPKIKEKRKILTRRRGSQRANASRNIVDENPNRIKKRYNYTTGSASCFIQCKYCDRILLYSDPKRQSKHFNNCLKNLRAWNGKVEVQDKADGYG